MSNRSQNGTLFKTLAYETISHIMRHLSKCPRRPLWHRSFALETFILMLEAGDVLEEVARDTFDGFTTHKRQTPEILPKDEFNRVTLTHMYNWNWIDTHAEKLNIRSLVLTPDFAFHFLLAESFVSQCSKTVNDLSLINFNSQHCETMRSVMAALGPNLTCLLAYADVPGLLKAILKHCQILRKLTIYRINGAVTGLSTVGDWRNNGDWRILCETLRVLTLSYANDCPAEDAELVRTSFRGLHELNISFLSNVSQESYQTAAKFYGGVWKHNLERANVGNMPANLISRIRSFYPSTRFTVRLGGTDTAAKLKACGDSLACAHFTERQSRAHIEFNGEEIEMAARGCGALEEIRLIDSWNQCKLGDKIFQTSFHRLRRIHLERTDVKVVDELASRAKCLREFYYSGTLPNSDVLNRLAMNNKQLQRVHFQTRNWSIPGVLAILTAFVRCPELNELIVNLSSRTYVDELIEALYSTPALGRYRIRRTFIRVAGKIFQE